MENFIEMLVSDKNAALDVYNALGDTAYTDTDKLTVDYIEEDVVCIRMEGDVAFVLTDIGGQKTTDLPGLPSQCMLYATKAICAYLETMGGIELLDGPTQIKIPTIKLVALCDVDSRYGADATADRVVTTLDGSITVSVHVYNINPDSESSLLRTCKTIREYVQNEKSKNRNTWKEFLADARKEAYSEAYNKAYNEGIAEGEAKFTALIIAMQADGAMADLIKAAADPELRARMYEKYGIE